MVAPLPLVFRRAFFLNAVFDRLRNSSGGLFRAMEEVKGGIISLVEEDLVLDIQPLGVIAPT